MASDFRTKLVAPGVNLMSGVTASATAGQKFFEKMYGPAQVQQFAKQNPEAFKAIVREMALFMGFSVNTGKPLGDSDFFNSKTGTLTVVGNGGEFTMPGADKILTKDELGKSNLLLQINPAVCLIGKDGVSISNEYPQEVRQFIKIYENMPMPNGWYDQVDGIPKGTPSDSKNPDALYLSLWSKFGSFWRGYSYYDINWRNVSVGYWLDFHGGVLVPTGSNAREIVAAAQKELGGKVGPAPRAAFEALREQA